MLPPLDGLTWRLPAAVDAVLSRRTRRALHTAPRPARPAPTQEVSGRAVTSARTARGAHAVARGRACGLQVLAHWTRRAVRRWRRRRRRRRQPTATAAAAPPAVRAPSAPACAAHSPRAAPGGGAAEQRQRDRSRQHEPPAEGARHGTDSRAALRRQKLWISATKFFVDRDEVSLVTDLSSWPKQCGTGGVRREGEETQSGEGHRRRGP